MSIFLWNVVYTYVITGKIGKKYLKNISGVRTNTAMRRRRLVYEGTKRKKLHFGAPDKEYGLAEPLLETLSEEQLNEKKLDFINQYIYICILCICFCTLWT